MTIELTDGERVYLSQLLEATHSEMLHELHHTATVAYKDLLKEKIALVEQLREKVGA